MRDLRGSVLALALALGCSSTTHTALYRDDAGGAGSRQDGAAGAAGGSAGGAGHGAGHGAGGAAGAAGTGGTPGDAGPDVDGGPDVATDSGPDVATDGSPDGGSAGGTAADASPDVTPDAPPACTPVLAAGKLPKSFPWSTFVWIEGNGITVYCPSGCGTCQITWDAPAVAGGKLVVPFTASCDVGATMSNCSQTCTYSGCNVTADGSGVASLPLDGTGPWTIHDAVAGAAWNGNTCRGGSSADAVGPAVQDALEQALDGLVLACP